MGVIRHIVLMSIMTILGSASSLLYAADANREHIDKINTHYVYYDVRYSTTKWCDYKIINKDVMTGLWKSGVNFLKGFGTKIPAQPEYLHQPPFTQSANDDIRTSGLDSANYYNQTEALLLARHESQDEALDQLLEEIQKTKGPETIEKIRNLDPAAIVALQLAKERFLLTSEQIQEKLVYYDLLDDKIENTIDKMLTGYLDASGQLPQNWQAPQNVQYMAVVELHLDNFRGLLHDTKVLTAFLAKCYGDLRQTYIATLINTTPEFQFQNKSDLMKGSNNIAFGSFNGSFTKPESISLDGVLDASSSKYQEKLQKKVQTEKHGSHSLSNIRSQIAAHSKLAAESGGILIERDRSIISEGQNADKQTEQKTAHGGKKEEQPTQTTVASTNSSPPPIQTPTPPDSSGSKGMMPKDLMIDAQKMLAEARSDEHNKAMIIDLRGRDSRMNETEYQVFKRSRIDYTRQEEDTIFIIISKAYHRVAFPRFLLPEFVEASQNRP